MGTFLKIVPIIILMIITFFVEIILKNYLISIGLTPKNTHFITIIALISYFTGLGVAYLSLNKKV